MPFVLGFIPPFIDGLGSASVFWSLAKNIKDSAGSVLCFSPARSLYPRLNDEFKPFPWTSFKEGRHSASLSGKTDGRDLFKQVSPPAAYLDCFDPDMASLLDVCGPAMIWMTPSFMLSQLADPPLIRKVSVVVIGVAPTLEGIEQALFERGRLLTKGVSAEDIEFHLLNAGIPGGIPVEMIREHVGLLSAVYPYDPEPLLHSESEGKPIQSIAPRSSLAAALRAATEGMLERAKSREARRGAAPAPSLSEAQIERRVIERLWRRLGPAEQTGSWTPGQIDHQIERELHAVLSENAVSGMGEEEVKKMTQCVRDGVMGLGPLEKLMRDDSISEIMVNGRDQLFVEREGRLEPFPEAFVSDVQLKVVIDRIVGQMGRRVDVSSPLCDVRTRDGSRVNVVLPPVSIGTPVVTIRRFRRSLLSFDDLIARGSLKPEDAERLKRHVSNRDNILIAGNSGSGKTTLLNILSGVIDETERIITLEDAAELKLQQPHVVRLETRPKNTEGEGEVTMHALVVNSLRMRPDRIIIGECRGAEVIPMLQAMNTGHDGSMTTLHANSAEDALQRLESMILLGAPQWPLDIVRQQIASSLDLIVYLKREGAQRRCTGIKKIYFDAGRLALLEE